jgi:hypothetical protein
LRSGSGGISDDADSTTTNNFDGIVFAERQANRWMSGSSISTARRVAIDQTDVSVNRPTPAGSKVMLAVTYRDWGRAGSDHRLPQRRQMDPAAVSHMGRGRSGRSF